MVSRGKGGAAQRGGGRKLTVKLRTAKGRKIASTRWLQRQLNDPYVQEAKQRGYRSRAAFKLIEIDDKAKLLKPGQRVVDLGAAPGGWTQVAVERVRAGRPRGGVVVAIDKDAMGTVPGATVLEGDMTDPANDARVMAALGGPADVVLSD